jgi:hypothetical protein
MGDRKVVMGIIDLATGRVWMKFLLLLHVTNLGHQKTTNIPIVYRHRRQIRAFNDARIKFSVFRW